MIEIKRFMLTWYDDYEKMQKWSGYDDMPSASKAAQYLLDAGKKPKLLQMLKDYK